ncbi:NADH dehydrogenase like protein [Verticillium longisporum]|uniref:NADH dehydrogenase like protein n=1 Tax=Verticillium longisporum TaxID=100787 RepID=A0A8I2ZMP0_VERLO|nr:NADH dehydrogenase like protein [Verticillium longisporum]
MASSQAARSYWKSVGHSHLRRDALALASTTNSTTTAVSSSPKTSPSTLRHATTDSTRPRERVVILGSGWAGYALARALDPAKYERIIVSPRSHFVFTPLLASTSVGTLEFRSILEPVRRLKPDAFHQGWADDIDFAHKTLKVETNADADELSSRTLPPPPSTSSPSGTSPSEVTIAASTPTMKASVTKRKGEVISIPYDKLVVAVGSYSQTFGIPGVREHANFLRDVGDARSIRLRVLQCFERAALPTATPEQRRALLHFAVVGGGPTGIEFAAELHDLIYEDLARLYPQLMPSVAITVYDIAPKVLPMFDKQLASYAIDLFKRQGIHVKTEHHLTQIRQDDQSPHGALKLSIQEEPGAEVGAGLVVWSTGLMPNPLVQKMVARELRLPGSGDSSPPETFHLQTGRSGGLLTDDHLRLRLDQGDRTLPEVFAMGDCAVMDREALPATAQVASQQAVYLARTLNRHGDDVSRAKPFAWRNLGTMAYLGSWRAIHQSSADGLRGRLAWVLWRGAYLTMSMSVRNKIMVPVHWFMTWVFGRDISRF